jgi:hypothetical protein
MAKLGQLLVARGWITVQQLTRALQNQSIVGGRLGTCLIEIDALSEDYLLKALAEQLGVPSAGVDDLRRIPEEVLALLPDKLARRCRAIPFRLEGSRLDLAMIDARNLACQDEIAFATGKRVKVHVAHELRILEALERYYREESPSRFSLLVERMNRARYFWEKSETSSESATTLAAPLTDLLGSRPVRIEPPPPLPEPSRPVRPPAAARPVAVPRPAPAPAPVAAAAPAAVAPRPSSSARPLTIPLTEEERAALVPLPLKSDPIPAPEPPPAPAPAPMAMPDLSTPEAAEKAFEAISDPERVGTIVLAFLGRTYRRTALFQAGKDKVTAWMALGDLNLDQFAKFSVSFDQPSVFLNLRQGTAFYVGPLPPMPAHRQLAGSWGGELPRDCVVLPVRMKDRLVAVIYADGAKKGLSGIDLQQLQRLAASTAAALQRCILHKKKSETGG